jgi:hypothetical protein
MSYSPRTEQGKENPQSLSHYSSVVTLRADRFNTKKILRSAHTVYLCVLCGSQNKQQLFPYTALTDWFV